uniref:calcium-dependent protein kinase 25-like n=1 Tax=Erigeron canadensis TaxID=72917 RepID=UPI001CB97AD1|nr:calcium-dependent protein kinase 25-like [Erigeron canadensis]
MGSFYEKYELLNELGSGSMGSVDECVEKETQIHYACKKIELRLDPWNELQWMKNLVHDNIVEVAGNYQDDKYVYIVMELCRGGTLYDRIIQKGAYDEPSAAKVMHQIMNALQYCHETAGVCHGDGKPYNMMYNVDDDEDAVLKLIDFGYTAKVTDAFSIMNDGPRVDVRDAGVILYSLLYGEYTDRTPIELKRRVTEGTFDLYLMEKPILISQEAKDLLVKMMSEDPNNRPTASQVLDHPWIKTRIHDDDSSPQGDSSEITRCGECCRIL